MGRTLYAFGDKLYELERTFTCMNQPQEFTIDPGEYLFICNGAAGGGTNASTWWGYGASAYGVFETDQTETLYAVVGGNGEAYDGTGSLHPGGYNGGGDGGTGNNGTGGSGGGASDIRLTLDETEVPPVYENNLPEGYQEQAFITLRHTHRGYINTGYLPRTNSKYEFDVYFHEWSSAKNGGWRCPFGCRSTDCNVDTMGFAVRSADDMRARAASYSNWLATSNNDLMMYNEKIHLTYDANTKRISWTNGKETKYIDMTHTMTNCPYPMFIFTLNNGGSPGDYYVYGMRFYRCKIYESDVLVHDYIPAKRTSDNNVGVYDLVDDTFIASSGSDPLTAIPKETNTRTLLSRILVAAGGGGDAKFSANRENTGCGCVKMAYGGGTIGSCVSSRRSSFYDSTEWNFPDQSTIPCDTRCKFGKGMNGPNRTQFITHGAEGGGGGGGGWYGGYAAANITAQYSSVGGGGGSSYALTADSYKPYGYIPTSHYYLKHSSLVPCQTTEGSILICRMTKTIQAEDTIIVPLTGQGTKIGLFPGTYNLKCWGGEGGLSIEDETRYQGGYSEGTLTLTNKHDIYGYVGGSGLWHDVRRYLQREDKFFNDQCGFNGGGMGSYLQQLYLNGRNVLAGGGATDLRLTNDQTPVHPSIPDPDTRDDIPSGYTQLKSVYNSDGGQIDTGYNIKSNTEVIYDFKIPSISGQYPTLLGTDSGPEVDSYVIFAGNGSGTIAFSGVSKHISFFVLNQRLKWHSIPGETTVTGIITDENGVDHTDIWEVVQGHTNNSHGLTLNGLNRNNARLNTQYVYIYGLKFYEDGVLVRDYVPCKRNSDNAIGLLELCTNTFVLSSNSNPTGIPLQTITYPSRSLMSRFIVAGGAGGRGYSSGLPGKGGGTSGGSPQNGNGTNMGPGTQSASPQSTDYPEINGGFGYGGNGVIINNGRGGAGGGGWFGGSGTYPDGSNDNDKGGSGGSGYVLTEDSWKPEYYIPTSEFYMSNGVTTLGGNTLPPNITKIEIDVIQAFCNKLLMYDMDGYKTYDEDQDKWVVFSQTINPSLIEEYGRYDIPNINGMLDEFQVVVDDPDNAISNIEVSAIPLPQSIVFLVPRRYSIGRTIIDAVYDTSIYDFSTNVSIYDDQYNAYTVTIDKTQESDEVLKLYSIMLFSQ